MAREYSAPWLAQLQRLQDLLARCHGVSLMVVDKEGNEITVPSGFPAGCDLRLADRAAGCTRPLWNAIARAQLTREPVFLSCHSGRECFVSPVGLHPDDLEQLCELFMLVSGTYTTDPDAISLIQQICRLVRPDGSKPAPAESVQVPSPPGRSPRPADVKLTDREQEILALIGAGFSNRDLAAHLYIAEATVKTHISHLFRKLHLANRMEARLFALREGLTASGATKP